jgi:hypothetical protein
MEQSPFWEANTRSAGQDTPAYQWIHKFHYHVHKSPPLEPILSQFTLNCNHFHKEPF